MVPFLIIIKFQQEIGVTSLLFHHNGGQPSFSSVQANFFIFETLFRLLESPMDLGLDICRYQGSLMV